MFTLFSSMLESKLIVCLLGGKLGVGVGGISDNQESCLNTTVLSF